MQVKVLRGKIHRAIVTAAEIDYEGSITIDRRLMDAANMIPYQEVEVWDVTNGERLQTYVMPGPKDSGVICINGAAARKVRQGDTVIVAGYGWADSCEASKHEPAIVRVDGRNRVVTA